MCEILQYLWWTHVRGCRGLFSGPQESTAHQYGKHSYRVFYFSAVVTYFHVGKDNILHDIIKSTCNAQIVLHILVSLSPKLQIMNMWLFSEWWVYCSYSRVCISCIYFYYRYLAYINASKKLLLWSKCYNTVNILSYSYLHFYLKWSYRW